MAKHYTLNTKNKKEADGYFYINGGFFHRFTCTKVTNIVVIVLQVISLILTSVCALCFGIFGAITIMSEGYDGMIGAIAGYIESAVTLWLVSSAVYVVGTLVLFLGFAKIATGIHFAAAVMSIVIYNLFEQANKIANIDSHGPAMLYMPCILIALVTLTIALVVNIPKWLDDKRERDNAVAPSILSDKED